MREGRLAVFAALALLFAAAAGCDTDTANTGAVNSNAVVVNNTNAAATNTAASNNNINANISREEFDRDKDRYQSEAREAGRKIGSGANDLWLWTKTRSALAYADGLRDVTINVDVENDVVTLTGTVGSEAQKAKAEQVAKSIEGVKSVQNKLTVTGS